MRAVRLQQPGKALVMQELPMPEPGPGDVLIQVRAAGVCHSDAHYRAGRSRVNPLPLTLGHEVAGTVERCGTAAGRFSPGDRVCVHYLATCGTCLPCRDGTEQFCPQGAMIGKYRDGGYADFIVMPERSVFSLPAEIPFEHGAVLMCSSATSWHALSKARLKPGETVAVFGAGGLGLSAIQLARARGASRVFAIDINPRKLALAQRLGACPVDARIADPVAQIRRATEARGVDVALELIGLPLTMRQAVLSLANLGRAALAGITRDHLELSPYEEILNREAEVIGVSDHLASELPPLLECARAGALRLNDVITRTIPLEAAAINDTLDRLEAFGDDGRVVVVPG